VKEANTKIKKAEEVATTMMKEVAMQITQLCEENE